MKTITNSQRQKQMKVLANLPDERIDTSDVPELTDEQLARAVRGGMYRPVKKAITIRLDIDVISWLKEEGRGYQTKANALLRTEMLRSCSERKGPRRAAATTRNAKKKMR